MKNISAGRRFWLSVSFLSIALGLIPQEASGADRQITFPSTVGSIIGQPGAVVFVHNAVAGLVLGGGAVGTPIRLFSFTVSDAVIVDDLVLDDFPHPLPSKPTARGMAVNDQSGLAAIFGNGADEAQTVVAVSADAAGKLTKKWAISHPNPIGAQAEAVINTDGSFVYFFYNDSSPKVDKIRAADGVVLGTVQLDDFDIEAGLTFNAGLRRLIVKTGFFFHVFKPEDDFAIDWRLQSPGEVSGVRQLFVSADHRFVIGYGGYVFGFAVINKANVFMTLDMEGRELRILSLKAKILPSGIALTFAPNTNALIVPYSTTVKVKGGTIKGCACGTQVADWLSLGQDGTLTRQFTTELTRKQGTIGPLNNAAFARTSAIAFLATASKRLVAIDTFTGEVISDQDVGDVFFIYRIGDTDTFVTTKGTNVLNLLDLNTGPSIDRVTVKKGKLLIKGANFLFGAHVLLNGEDLGVVERDPQDPAHQIIVRQKKKNLPQDQEITVVVVNRDGLSSNPLTFKP
jgi:hypothetical protein